VRWISLVLIVVLLLGGGYFYWQRVESSKVVYVFLPEVPVPPLSLDCNNPADRTVLYNTRRTLFKYGKPSANDASWEEQAVPI